MAQTEYLLDISSLSAYYTHPDRLALENVNIQVREGEIVSLIGPNGAGKSTVLKTIYKEVRIKEGVCSFNGEDLSRKEPTDFPTMGICFVPEGRRLFRSMTVEENLDTGGYLIRNVKEIVKRKEKIYHFFPVLKERRNVTAKKLSGGEQQMLAFGRALMLNPRLLLLDEPSIGLAPKMMDLIFEQVRVINRDGVAILLVEQNVRKALDISDRVYVLNLGRVAFSGSPGEIRENAELRGVYFGG